MTVGDGRKFFSALHCRRRFWHSSMPAECDREKTEVAGKQSSVSFRPTHGRTLQTVINFVGIFSKDERHRLQTACLWRTFDKQPTQMKYH
ncbi:hypothetical protein V2K52_14780 [Pseudomonas alliivorans]|uniref:hypothetical protein n=1 Tax=Pseudomonas alliivorans TaxID=2810613 RepID=UPI0016107BA9|nr:hypothetical protein [Pseudomonas alliivorans]MBP0949892.1 hypothetical protein [Pseudomonas alliivorans]MEE4343478.1 hypothetical protein [Pseudomonas alliivorans]MEE4618839.1 hypothetical protein [Pseudomonas alliivorans]MEE4632049.1 hypothetical protein [Pseudomonas alliivorans]MEE4649821.1 hypothetical protein [Pseudomonas alliivorans]